MGLTLTCEPELIHDSSFGSTNPCTVNQLASAHCSKILHVTYYSIVQYTTLLHTTVYHCKVQYYYITIHYTTAHCSKGTLSVACTSSFCSCSSSRASCLFLVSNLLEKKLQDNTYTPTYPHTHVLPHSNSELRGVTGASCPLPPNTHTLAHPLPYNPSPPSHMHTLTWGHWCSPPSP